MKVGSAHKMQPTLLAVLEVDYAQRVRCQAPACGKSVYRRIHVVEQEDGLRVLGEDCCSRLFGWDKNRPAPRLAVPEGRRLNTSERELLVANTDLLLASLASELELQRAAALEKLQRLKALALQSSAVGTMRSAGLDPAQRHARQRISFQQSPPPEPNVLAEALRRMQDRWQLDAHQAQSPGWTSLLRDVIAEIEREKS